MSHPSHLLSRLGVSHAKQQPGSNKTFLKMVAVKATFESMALLMKEAEPVQVVYANIKIA